MNHVMLDLETLDTTPSAVIVSIGACRFDPNTGEVGEKFYAILDRDSQTLMGRTSSDSTLKWWNEPGQAEARKVFEEPVTEVRRALHDFSNFLPLDVGGIWGNGAAFDNVILWHAFRQFGLDLPPFWTDRCFRTIKALGKANGIEPPPFRGTAHNALDDAVHQAQHLGVISQALGMRW